MAPSELFPHGDFRFHLTLRRGEPVDFFARRDATGRLLAERRRWIESDGGRYAELQPDGQGLVDEFLELTVAWGVADAGRLGPVAAMREIGGSFEPDLLFLAPDEAGQYRLRGGAVCFPTGWALDEKMGRTLDWIHGAVPGLNPALAAPIGRFLTTMKPGVAYLRDNWGIAATEELHLHPGRDIPAPTRPVDLTKLWLRVEHQALVALPRSRGVAFGIRIALHRLDGLAGTPAGAGLRRALDTMPPEVAAYKRLAEVRADVAALLAGHP
jgi:hypothetical protein